jgi:hypothetical protein
MTLATEITETLQNRAAELQEWERKRQNEVSLDLFAHYCRLARVLIPIVILFAVLCYFKVPGLLFWCFTLAVIALARCSATLIIWLRLEGAFIERRLEEIEARLQGDYPTYYTKESPDRLERNGLHEKLGSIEELLRRQREVNHV